MSVPSGTVVTYLVPTIVRTGTSMTPTSGVAQNFTNPVTYTVTSEDGSTQIYTITVTVLPSTNATVTAGSYTVSAGGTGAETTSVPFGTSKAVFLAAVTKSQAGQTWDSTNIADPVVHGNTLVVTAENGTTVVTYTVIGSTNATVTSGSYTVSAGGTGTETITSVPFGTSKAVFLAAVTKSQAGQTWDSTNIADPVVHGNTLVVTAENGTTVVTYTVIGSTNATVTSGSYTVSAGGTGTETITSVPFGTSKAVFLAAVTKGQAGQTWDSTNIADPVVHGNTLVVTAENGTTVVTYTVISGTNATVTSGSYTVSAGGMVTETITNVPFGTSKAVFLAAVTRGQAGQTWDSTNIADPVVHGNTLVVIAENGTVVTYTVIGSTNATVTSGSYTVSAGGTGDETISMPFSTGKAAFLAAVAKGQAGQTWDDINIADPVVSGNTLVVTAENGTTVVTYTVVFEFAGGSGTVGDPYQITKLEHLNNVRKYLNKHFILMNDLDFNMTKPSDYENTANKITWTTGQGWVPIGGSIGQFIGNFNGNGYEITV